MLCVVPALRAVRTACPNSRITLIGLPWAASFVSRFGAYVDDFIEFPGHPALPERVPDADALPRFFEESKRRGFDVAIQLHGSGPVVNRLVEQMGARRSAGYFLTNEDHDSRGFYVRWPNGGHEIEKWLWLVRALGAPAAGQHLEFPVTDAERAEAETLLQSHGIEAGRYVCVHPGARLKSRRWHPERFAEVADFLASLGYQVIITGSEWERPLTADVRRRMRADSFDLKGEVSLGGLAALIAGARLLVSNDTGVSHIAAAVGTPSVIVTTGSDPRRWSPLDAERHATVYRPVDCRPCAFDVCPIGHPCADAVTADLVIAEIEKQLNRRTDAFPQNPHLARSWKLLVLPDEAVAT
ncbi:MAG: glycosyltransferase family 9 protein [Elusimicrobia bacterium]|nr:glycosyltransferase family 9 protein [Elusimicrobiota bacterium]